MPWVGYSNFDFEKNVLVDFSYREGDSVWSCSGCLKYTCTGRPCQDRAGSKFKMFWVVESIGAQCCQSCAGVIFPPNTVMSSRSLGGECDLQEVVTCAAPEQGNNLCNCSYPDIEIF